MTGEEVIKSFENAWKALSDIYNNNPSEVTRFTMNVLSEMINEVKSEMRKKEEEEKKAGQISIDEWMNWFKSEE